MKIAFFVALAVILVLSVFTVLTGDGGLQRMTTLSGIYTVENPSGYNVVCFVERNSGSMECLTGLKK